MSRDYDDHEGFTDKNFQRLRMPEGRSAEYRGMRSDSDRPAVFILIHGIGEPGQLEFPEYPEVAVQVPGALGVVLVALESEWVRMSGQATRNRGWLNKPGLHEAYSKIIQHKVSDFAVRKYAIRLITKIKAAFPDLKDPPTLLERDLSPQSRRGTHLMRDLEIHDFTKLGMED